MAKVKRASASVMAPRDQAEAETFLQRIGEAQRHVTLIETGLSENVARLKECAELDARPHQTVIAQCTAGLQLWAEANRPALTRNHATKTIKLVAGEIAWRLRPASVRITGTDAVIEAMQRLGFARFLRTKTEIDKEAMLKEPALAGKIPGVKVGTEGEDFIVTPSAEALPNAAAAA